MATKSKNSKRILLAVFLVACCAAVTLLGYLSIDAHKAPQSYERETEILVEKSYGGETWPLSNGSATANLKGFVRCLYMGSYGMYWQLQEKVQGSDVRPSDVLLLDADEGEGEGFAYSFTEWFGSFLNILQDYDVDYQITDQETGVSYSSSAQNLAAYGESGAPFFLQMGFDGEGNLSIKKMENKDGISLGIGEVGGLSKQRFLNEIGAEEISPTMLVQPKNVDIYVYSWNSSCYYTEDTENQGITCSYVPEYAYSETVAMMYFLILALIFLCAVLLPPFRALRKEGRLLEKIPVEFSAAAVLLQLLAYFVAVELCGGYINRGQYSREFLYMALNFAYYLVVYGAWFVTVLALLQVVDVGIRAYFRERSLLAQLWGWGKRGFRRFLDSVKTIDLSDRSDIWLLKVVGLNFVVAGVCCLMWGPGLIMLVIYSAALFFMLRKYLEDIRKKYGRLLLSARKMAEGNLEMDVKEDLGLFEPLKEELAKVNQGFKKAVDEEVKSQNMKTELITNVSHDLKTPLTAIITYVNLLKDENITPEERRSYVDILDRKSLRLKNLIEDLFEVSKAASGNIQIVRSRVDLCEMVKQAAAEQEDRMGEAKIDCRVQTPEEPVFMELDGEKTYRVLENLLVNVTKYAMTGTRAWLSLSDEGTAVEIVLKNISAMELDEDTSRLTERFTRGDKARNTEGSGLGLAIVQSFVELQGGTFRIVVDGDLFKAIVRFPKGGDKSSQPES